MPPEQASAGRDQPPSERHDRDCCGDASEGGARRTHGTRRPFDEAADVGQRAARLAQIIGIDARDPYKGAILGGFRSLTPPGYAGHRMRSIAVTR